MNKKMYYKFDIDNRIEILSYLNQQNTSPIIPLKRNCLHQRDYKSFKVLKKRDNSFIVNFIVLVISLKILSLL